MLLNLDISLVTLTLHFVPICLVLHFPSTDLISVLNIIPLPQDDLKWTCPVLWQEIGHELSQTNRKIID